jgi:hypothetical protein
MTTFGEIRLARSSFRLSFRDNSFVPSIPLFLARGRTASSGEWRLCGGWSALFRGK